MGATELWLVRHGESVANVAATAAMDSGEETIPVEFRDADVPLSPLGEEQASSLGDWLAEHGRADAPAAAWASSYLRAQQTLAIALERSGLSVTTAVDERLRDRELGILDLLTPHGVDVRYPDEAARRTWVGRFYYRPPGGESWADVALRVRSFLADVDLHHDGGRILVASHDAVVMLFLYVCIGMSERELIDFGRTHTVTNASVTRLSRPSGTGAWTLDVFSHDDHLADHPSDDGAMKTEHPGDRVDDER